MQPEKNVANRPDTGQTFPLLPLHSLWADFLFIVVRCDV